MAGQALTTDRMLSSLPYKRNSRMSHVVGVVSVVVGVVRPCLCLPCSAEALLCGQSAVCVRACVSGCAYFVLCVRLVLRRAARVRGMSEGAREGEGWQSAPTMNRM
jgi:hypothetical protein